MKKTLSFLLALTLLICALPFSAAAKDTIEEVHIKVDMPKDVSAYSLIPTVASQQRTQFKIAKWFWYNESKDKKMGQNESFNIIDTYSLNLVLNSSTAYDFANDGQTHSLSAFVDGTDSQKYSALITKADGASLGDACNLKFTFVSDRNVPEISVKSYPAATENNTLSYALSLGKYVEYNKEYDNGTTVKNGIMWEDISDPDNEIKMKPGDKFAGTHTYRLTAFIKTLDTFKYNISTNNINVGSAADTSVEFLDTDAQGYVTKFKITRQYSTLIHSKHNWVQTTVKPATIDEDGLKRTDCSVCGASLPDTIIPHIQLTRVYSDYQIYNKSGNYFLDIVLYSNSQYNYRRLQRTKDYDVVFTKTGESIYETGGELKRLALGTYNYKIVFKGDFAGTINRKITVNLAAPRFESISGRNTVKLTWNKVDGATFYRVFEKDVKTGKVKCLASKVTANAFVIKNKISGTKYQFTVRAYRTTAAGKTYCSAYSFKDVYTRCAAPVIKAKVSGNKVTISWKAVRGAGNYCLYKYNSGKEVFEEFKYYYIQKTSVTFSAIKGTYLFKVASRDRNGISGQNFSNSVKVTVK